VAVSPSIRAASCAAILSLALPAVACAGSRVRLRGTAYEFNNTRVLLGGATIRIAEFPRLKATVRPDGTYDLAVPDRARVTPYIKAAGHHTIYLQTFTTAGENLSNVNFQTPSDPIYEALARLLNVPVDAAGNPKRCAIVSTFSTGNVRDLDYAGLIAYGAHGVPGATATASPALPPPTYFNAQVIPDPAQQLSSEDGGVLWIGVPAGVYTIRAHKAGTRFASFVATCRPGRIVNANPPWGLHELGLRNPTRLRATARSIRLTHLPKGATVRVSGRTVKPVGDTLDLARGARRSIEVVVSAHRYNTTVWRVAGRRVTKLCVPLGDSRPRPTCR
jgi:hypothetical protein